jgi:glycosyltransferase involved in cell wall biosynthesis
MTMQNVLFAIDRDFSSNSAIHVHALANELCRLGMDCVVAVPRDKQTVTTLGATLYRPMDFREASKLPTLFANGAGPDVVHSWTPREIVRKFCDQLRSGYRFKQFIHLEDNEEHLLEKLRDPAAMTDTDADYPDWLSHPERHRDFLNRADGVTVIIERLAEFVSGAVPNLTLWPGVNASEFFPRPANPELANKLQLPLNSTVLVYPGNVHPANTREVRSLYLAVAILNREGHSTCLVRTGADHCDFLGDNARWAKPYLRELGFIPRAQMPDVLALADMFVQPGQADVFNEYRFPSKLPEFMAMGKPVILPKSNIGRSMTHGRDAWVVENADGVQIAEAVRHICGNPELYARLAAGALEFARTRLSWPEQAAKLRAFYLQV